MKAFCLKCRDKKEIIKPEEVKMKNGAIRVYGVCETCDGKVSTIKSGKQ